MNKAVKRKIREIENWSPEDVKRKIDEAVKEILQHELKGRAKVIKATSNQAELLLPGALITVRRINNNSGYTIDVKAVVRPEAIEIIQDTITVLEKPFWRSDNNGG